MKNPTLVKFDVKQMFQGLKYGLCSKFTIIEIQIVAADNVNETPELLKPAVSWPLSGAGFYVLYLLLPLYLPLRLLDSLYPYLY